MTQESDDIYLLTEVASLYYEENYTQEQIARMIGISRSGVSRLLSRSRELGLVDIHVHQVLRTSAALQEELIARFGLQDAQVLETAEAEGVALDRVGALAARYVDRRIQESHAEGKRPIRTVGISWGTSMLEMLKALRPRRRLPLNVVQLMGSVDTSSRPDIDGPEIARRLADAYGGRCYYLHAPLLVADASVREGLLKERSLRRSFQMMEQMDMALVGIGGARPEASGLFRAGYLDEEELQVIRSQGAVGDICGCYFDIEGRLCAHELLCRTVTVSFETLRKVPLVIAVAAGVAKKEAMLGALRTGVVKVLITDEPGARALLQLASSQELAQLPG
ncbi:sugar-binding transcriptional regulator [Thermogemmatispora sp.]|uniref:sugar-binding transcriptional regulator n=1 Tax=Thermogemmatispora sp. TaxID=1968838 RepID=UPI001D7294FF|nr:sugar-binding transcriptional regulator [Thermogemmatispora sp.]MBX5448970.1 sugar-binding transcriptional regulator [Thermogemmatispora sp.]